MIPRQFFFYAIQILYRTLCTVTDTIPEICIIIALLRFQCCLIRQLRQRRK